VYLNTHEQEKLGRKEKCARTTGSKTNKNNRPEEEDIFSVTLRREKNHL
jgi:hypothetical protein